MSKDEYSSKTDPGRSGWSDDDRLPPVSRRGPCRSCAQSDDSGCVETFQNLIYIHGIKFPTFTSHVPSLYLKISLFFIYDVSTCLFLDPRDVPSPGPEGRGCPWCVWDLVTGGEWQWHLKGDVYRSGQKGPSRVGIFVSPASGDHSLVPSRPDRDTRVSGQGRDPTSHPHPSVRVHTPASSVARRTPDLLWGTPRHSHPTSGSVYFDRVLKSSCLYNKFESSPFF